GRSRMPRRFSLISQAMPSSTTIPSAPRIPPTPVLSAQNPGKSSCRQGFPLMLVGRRGSVSEDTEWAIPPKLQPDPADYRFDLDAALRAVVGVKTVIPDDAYT